MKVLATIISYLFHPSIVTSYIFGMVLFFHPNVMLPSMAVKIYLISLVGTTTFLLPVLFVFILLKLKVVSSLHLEKQKERTLPFFFTALMYYLTYVNLQNINYLPPLLSDVLMIVTASVIMLGIVNLKYKISAHAAGIGGLVCISFLIYNLSADENTKYLPMAASLIAGMVFSSRLYLNAHTSMQVYSGGLLGFSIAFGSYFLM